VFCREKCYEIRHRSSAARRNLECSTFLRKALMFAAVVAAFALANLGGHTATGQKFGLHLWLLKTTIIDPRLLRNANSEKSKQFERRKKVMALTAEKKSSHIGETAGAAESRS